MPNDPVSISVFFSSDPTIAKISMIVYSIMFFVLVAFMAWKTYQVFSEHRELSQKGKGEQSDYDGFPHHWRASEDE